MLAVKAQLMLAWLYTAATVTTKASSQAEWITSSSKAQGMQARHYGTETISTKMES